MIPLGSKAPSFNLHDVTSEKTYTLNDLASKEATVIMFICNHCPYVKHINTGLVQLAYDYQQKGVSFIAINSNDANNYPDDSPEKMKETALSLGYPFPYLFDETQDIAKAYSATCTPDFFIYDGKLSLIYRGQIDGSRPGNGKPVIGKDMRLALDAHLAGQGNSNLQQPSMGCNIKWKT